MLAESYNRISMRRLATLVALLLLVMTAAPMLACVTGEAMTQQESACCRQMHGQCGDMAKMGCCNKKVAADTNPQLKTGVISISVGLLQECIALIPTALQPPSPTLLKMPDEHPPPGLLIVRVTNLRI